MTKKYDNLYDVATDIIEKTRKKNFRRVKIIAVLILVYIGIVLLANLK